MVQSFDKVKSGYELKVWIIMFICMGDIFLNGYADNVSFKPEESFMPYLFVGFQIAMQIGNILLVFMLFSGTYLFQVGLLDLQLREFKLHLAGIFAYMGLYLAYGGTKLFFLPLYGAEKIWELPGFVTVSILQKLGSMLYYMLLLTICARMGDTIWYLKAPWVHRFSMGPFPGMAASEGEPQLV